MSENIEENKILVDSSVNAVKPSAPTADDNGYIVVGENSENSAAAAAAAKVLVQEEAKKVVESTIKAATEIIDAASTKDVQVEPKSCTDSNKPHCTVCPYYLLGFSYLKNVRLPQKVEDLVLWKNPKCTGSCFGLTLVLLISLACFSLLTVVGSFLLLGLTVAGVYRLYLSLIYRIKGQYDDTFDKLSTYKVNLPKEKFQEISSLIEKDLNIVLNQLKSILLWDNLRDSLTAFFGFYVLYCVGSVFNTLTLITIGFVALFTLPKFYQVYQKPIDQGIEKMTQLAHQVAHQISAKMPFLHKKKTQ